MNHGKDNNEITWDHLLSVINSNNDGDDCLQELKDCVSKRQQQIHRQQKQQQQYRQQKLKHDRQHHSQWFPTTMFLSSVIEEEVEDVWRVTFNDSAVQYEKGSHCFRCTTLLHHAAGLGNVEICRWLLDQIVATDDNNNDNNSSHQDLVQLRRMFLYARSQKHGRTALHWAARNGHCHVVKLLVHDYGMDPNAYAKGDVTPLELAVWKQQLSVCKLLVNELGAHPFHTNSWGCGLVHWLGKSVNPIELERYRWTLTHDRQRCNTKTNEEEEKEKEENGDYNFDSSTMILSSIRTTVTWQLCHWLDQECGLNLSSSSSSQRRKPHQNQYGQTCLHKAAYEGNYIVCMYLRYVHRTIDNVRDQQHNLAADCAERNSRHDVAQWLRRYMSECIWETSLRTLQLNNNTIDQQWNSLHLPSLDIIRSAYLKMAKKYHPDRSRIDVDSIVWETCSSACHTPRSFHEKSINPDTCWHDIHDAYVLLKTWWLNPHLSDQQTRQRSRYAQLQTNVLFLMWHDDWHQQRQQRAHIGDFSTESSVDFQRESFQRESCPVKKGSSFQGSYQTNCKKDRAIPPEAMERLKGFEMYLVKLLSSIQPHHELPLTQLPKEYRKVWGNDVVTKFPIPNPKHYRCKRLSHVIQKHCHDHIQVIGIGEPNGIQRVRLLTTTSKVPSPSPKQTSLE